MIDPISRARSLGTAVPTRKPMLNLQLDAACVYAVYNNAFQEQSRSNETENKKFTTKINQSLKKQQQQIDSLTKCRCNTHTSIRI